jgi:sialic acid synthase SpsE
MVQGIRAAERALGSSVKKMLDEEAEHARRASLHAAKKIEEGDAITRDHLVVERPAGGIPSRFCEAVTQTEARVGIQKGEELKWDKVNLK